MVVRPSLLRTVSLLARRSRRSFHCCPSDCVVHADRSHRRACPWSLESHHFFRGAKVGLITFLGGSMLIPRFSGRLRFGVLPLVVWPPS